MGPRCPVHAIKESVMQRNASPAVIHFALMLALPLCGCPADTVGPIDAPDPVSPMSAAELCGL